MQAFWREAIRRQCVWEKSWFEEFSLKAPLVEIPRTKRLVSYLQRVPPIFKAQIIPLKVTKPRQQKVQKTILRTTVLQKVSRESFICTKFEQVFSTWLLRIIEFISGHCSHIKMGNPKRHLLQIILFKWKTRPRRSRANLSRLQIIYMPPCLASPRVTLIEQAQPSIRTLKNISNK